MRWWHELMGHLDDRMPGGIRVAGLALLAGAMAVALLWYTWPEWWHLLRAAFRRPERTSPAPAMPAPAAPQEDEAEAADALPDRPARELAVTADELAAQGRYREAVRERLRAILRELVERGLVDPRPGWTVTELAAMAARTVPALAAAVTAASDVFSAIWYGQRPARAHHDTAMREHAAAVRAVLGSGSREARPPREKVTA